MLLINTSDLYQLSLTLTIMVQLKPDIYRLIIKALISSDDGVNDNASPFPAKCPETPSTLLAPIRKSRQAALVSLMQVSKVSIVMVSMLTRRPFMRSVRPSCMEIV